MWSDCAWSIHFCRRAAASITHDVSISNAVAYSARNSTGTRSILVSEPSKYLRSEIITSSHRLRAFRSLTRYSLTTVNSPDRFDLTKMFWYDGSMHAETPMMLEIVAVGAIATQFELRIPYCLMRARNASHSSVAVSSRST